MQREHSKTMENAKEVIEHAASNPKAAAAVAAVTGSVSIGTLLEWLPPLIALVASFLTAILTAVLIWRHIVTTRADLRKSQAEHELALLKAKKITDSE